jgi:hypothetical protein
MTVDTDFRRIVTAGRVLGHTLTFLKRFNQFYEGETIDLQYLKLGPAQHWIRNGSEIDDNQQRNAGQL